MVPLDQRHTGLVDPLPGGVGDAVGLAEELPGPLLYRLGGRDSIGGTSIWGYDRVIVPVSRLLQRVASDRLIGKNVLLIATRR